ncbi:MAG: 50S ribosomal protein L11 [Candidatus Pacearchaeota archaeon]
MQIKLLVDAGDLKPGPVLSQKLGPLGIPMGNVIKEVNEATQGFKGMKVPVILDVTPSTKEFTVSVSSPPVSELLKKEIGIEKGSGEQDRMKVANASIEQIISVSKTKFPDMLSKDLKAAVKTVVGSAVSLGILIENKEPKEIEEDIDEGKYDTEISEEQTETPSEKREKLDKFFEVRKKKQERDLKALEAAKAAEEAAAEAEKAEAAKAEGEKDAKSKEVVPEKEEAVKAPAEPKKK